MDKKILELYSDLFVASTSLTTTALSKDEAIPTWIKELDISLIQTIQQFENEDGSSDTLYLINNDVALNFDDIIDFYYEQWKIEKHHKSLKKSPAKVVWAQSNHIFASVYAYVKLKLLWVKTSLSHFTLKSKIYIKALKSALSEIHLLHNQVDIRLTDA